MGQGESGLRRWIELKEIYKAAALLSAWRSILPFFRVKKSYRVKNLLAKNDRTHHILSHF